MGGAGVGGKKKVTGGKEGGGARRGEGEKTASGGPLHIRSWRGGSFEWKGVIIAEEGETRYSVGGEKIKKGLQKRRSWQ